LLHPVLPFLLPLLALWAASPSLAAPGSLPTATTPAAPTRPATVLSLRNGQELRVHTTAGNRRVRLACLQAPRPEQQPWAERARQQLAAALPPGSAVEVELRARDVFGREVAVVRRDGTDVALELLRSGAVFFFDGYLGNCADLPYPMLEAEARRQRLGVWSRGEGIERPWNVLQRQRNPDAEP
jgi:micrococcal nuclease